MAADNSKSEKSQASFVGYANLPNQVFRKAVKRGFQFTLMAVGQSGLGKSTLINSLFMSSIYEDSAYNSTSSRLPKTTEIVTSKVTIQEGGVHLELTMVDTPGFGDVVDNSNCWNPIINFIDSKFDEYLNAESRVVRGFLEDMRVHCCLYFIPPNGHGLRQIDVEFMKQLHEKVNIIPVIAKADTFTPDECLKFKRKVFEEIHNNGIKIYQFPDGEGDEEDTAANKKLKEAVPFAVVGSNTVLELNSKKVRGRLYPWGVAEVENTEHCDFSTLRNMLISDPMAQFEVEKKEHEIKMRKMEQEMEEVFEMKVQEKMQKLREIEADLNRRKEQMKKTLEQQQQELNNKRRQFDEDKRHFEDEHQKYMEEVEATIRAGTMDKKGGGKKKGK